METFLIYLLKSSGIIALFLLFYLLFLRRETFFRTNRIYLLMGLGFAVIVPFLVFTRTVWLPPVSMYQIQTPDQLGVAPTKADSIDWIALIFYGYCAGVLLFAIRFTVQFLSLKKLIGSGEKIEEGKFIKIETDQKGSPFSFFTYLVYNPTLHTPSELGTILAHEKIHAEERHSLDILAMQLFAIFQWCNPFVWWYRTYLYDNLEYLADTGTIAKNTNKVEYQYLLLRTGMGEKHYPMATPFFNNSIKKRIIMLNKNRSNGKNSFKYALMLPLLVGFIFLFNVKTEAQVKSMDSIQADTNKYGPVTFDKERSGDFPDALSITKNPQFQFYIGEPVPLYLLGGKEISKTEFDKIDPNSIESISVWKGQRAIDRFGEKGKDGVVEIILKKDYLNIPKTNYSDSLKIRTRGTNTNENKQGFDVIGATNPLYLLDGKEISKSDLDKIDPSTIESINVLKKESTIEAYGDKGKNGVVVIKTKSKWKVGMGLNSNSFDPKWTAMEYYQQMEKTAPSGYPLPDIDKALILIDGKPSSKNDLESITADQIKMLFPIAAGDKDAIKKYGDQAKNGVIEIVTKKK